MAGVAMSILKSSSRQLGSLLVEEAKFLYDVSDKLEELKFDLEWLQCFMQDADKQQHESELICMWISHIRDFAYEAEDIIDKYMVRVTHPRKDGIWNALKWASCVLRDAKELHEIGSDITTLSLRMSNLSSRLQICGVKAIAKDDLHITSTRLVDPRRSNPQIRKNDIIVGLNEDARTLVHQLINTNKNVVVISGMGGLGKTTLARKVYNEKAVKAHFSTRVWIYVSQEFQAMDIFKEILRKIWEYDAEKRKSVLTLGDDELSEKLCEALKEKSYLLVLDDVWNVRSWNCLKTALSLPSNSNTKLLLTTRNHELQGHVDVNGYLHKQEPLNPVDSWNLLKTIASQGGYDIVDEMKKLGEMMLKKSKYLPIAIVAIGGILKSKNTIEEWTTVHMNIHSIFTITGEEGMGVLDVLELSYRDLPLFLKPCFLYLASFSEDYEISAKKLYHLWDAEGLVSTNKLKNHVARFQRVVTFCDMAEPYLEELVSRNMVQVEKYNDKGKIKSCRMHDLMRDMCIQKATEEGYVSMISTAEEVGEKASSSATVPMINSRLRRLGVHINGDPNKTSDALNKAIQNSKHLRSILLFRGKASYYFLKSCCKNSLLLRVVDIEVENFVSPMPWYQKIYDFYDFDPVSLPKEIKNLIHLKYLSLRNSSVTELPSSIVKLQCLQTLDLRVSFYVTMKIPNILWKLRRLRHLYLPCYQEVDKPFYKVRKPLWFHTLCHLETLKNLNLGISRVEDLVVLKCLTRLTLSRGYCITQTNEVKKLKLMLSSPKIASGLLAKPMDIIISGELLNEELVDELLQLQGFKLSVGGLDIYGQMSISLESVQIAFWNLTTLTLYKGESETDPMAVLERLPKLSTLNLYDYTIIGKKMICSTGWFPELIHLKLDELKDLEEFRVGEGAMPKLQRLVIEDCNKLKQFDHMLPNTVHIVLERNGLNQPSSS